MRFIVFMWGFMAELCWAGTITMLVVAYRNMDLLWLENAMPVAILAILFTIIGISTYEGARRENLL